MPDEAYSDSPEDGRPRPAAPLAGLVLVSTPIGNLGDIAPRARQALADSDLILCEDTRHTARLLSAIGIGVRTEPLHEYNEDARIAPVLAMLRSGRRIATPFFLGGKPWQRGLLSETQREPYRIHDARDPVWR